MPAKGTPRNYPTTPAQLLAQKHWQELGVLTRYKALTQVMMSKYPDTLGAANMLHLVDEQIQRCNARYEAEVAHLKLPKKHSH